jgi:hypothetical protein
VQDLSGKMQYPAEKSGGDLMTIVHEVFPNIEAALDLDPEELAVPLIETLYRYGARHDCNMFHRGNFINSGHLENYAGKYVAQFMRTLTEAWMWLQQEGLIAPQPAQTPDWIFITRRGTKFREMGDVQKFKAANLLPAKILDPTLVQCNIVFFV